jgi:hypothetical protein
MASFETSLYGDNNQRRADFGIAELFGIHATGERCTRIGSGFMGGIEHEHPILSGFTDTDWLPGAQWLQPIAPVADSVMTVIPPFVNYPPELAYPPVARTGIADLLVREIGSSRLVYFAGDIERTALQSGNTDLINLLQNAIRWTSRGAAPVRITGKGLIESFAWETRAGFALHILNYTNPAAFKGYIREFYPIGEQNVSFSIPNGRTVSQVQLLRAEKPIPFRHSNGRVEFTIPRVTDYEVAAIHAG